MKKVLGIDIGTNLGWCYGTGPGEYGVWRLKSKLSTERPGRPFLDAFNRLSDLIGKNKIEGVAFEEITFLTNAAGQEKHFGLRATMFMVCEMFEIPALGINVSSLKKFATGRGRADKDEMVNAANYKFKMVLPHPDIEKTSGDIADAVHAWDWGRQQPLFQ